MSASMLGPVRCQHRWAAGPELPYPRTAPALDGEELGDEQFVIETASCKRCGRARLRLQSVERRYVCSSWGYAESMTEVLLGRPLEEYEERRVAKSIALN